MVIPTRLLMVLAGGLAMAIAPISAAKETPVAANWISNPSFEEGEPGDPVDWVFFKQHEKTTGIHSPAHARSGSLGAGIRGEGGLSYGRWLTPYRIPLEPGAKYRVSFWYRGKGGSVHVFGQSAQLSNTGNLMSNLNKRFKTKIAAPPPSEEWTYFEEEFTAPGYPSWAQLDLTGSKRETCSFDDIAFVRAGLTLVEPTVPLVTPSGKEFRIGIYSSELLASAQEAVQWTVASPLELIGVEKNPETGIWTLALRSTEAGTHDLKVEASAGGKPLKLAKARHVRLHPAGMEKLFTFAAVTDTHFYSPGENERNAKFAALSASINALDPLFVLSLGDQMDIHNGFRDEEKKWIVQAVKEQLGLLRMPVFMIAGNHDIDRTYEGTSTRWYFEKYLGQPRYWSFQVGDALFAGVDVSTPGVSTREHGASFLDEEQAAWFEKLLAGPLKNPAVVAGHISPFTEWSSAPDRNRFLKTLLGGNVGIYLCGHQHYIDDRAVVNGSSATGAKPEPLANAAEAQAAIDDPRRTAILTTTTACAFELGEAKSSGFRYALVRDGKVAWQAVIPSTLRISREDTPSGSVAFTLKNGTAAAMEGLPLVVHSTKPGMSAKIDGADAKVEHIALSNSLFANLIRIDLPAGSERRIEFLPASQ